jgi:hypothetical protein
VDADFSKPGGNWGTLWFAEFDQFGTPLTVDPEWSPALISPWQARQAYLLPQQLYQAQVWVTAPRELTATERKTALELLFAVRNYFHDQITTASGPAENAAPNSDNSAATKAATAHAGDPQNRDTSNSK